MFSIVFIIFMHDINMYFAMQPPLCTLIINHSLTFKHNIIQYTTVQVTNNQYQQLLGRPFNFPSYMLLHIETYLHLLVSQYFRHIEII